MSPSRSRRRKRRKKKSYTKLILIVVAVLVAIAVIIVAYNMLGNNGESNDNLPSSTKVLFETSMGNILIELREDMPITVNNFKGLVQDGVYDDTTFHRVVNTPNSLVMIQGGNPATGSWSGGSIPMIPDEFSDNSENNKNKRGTISMANRGANTGSSQFFINGDYNTHLDNVHPVFGDVVDGLGVVDQILEVETAGEFNEPVEDVTLIRAQLID